MKEKRSKRTKHCKHKSNKDCRQKKRKHQSSSSSSTSESDEWVEKELDKPPPPPAEREDWMSMTGMLKTYTKDDIRPKREVKDKQHIDSYNPSTSSRELNPYWKDGGTGIPETAESFRKQAFVKPSDGEDFYRKPSSSRDSSSSSHFRDHRRHDRHSDRECKDRGRHENVSFNQRGSGNWRRGSEKWEEKETEQLRRTKETLLNADRGRNENESYNQRRSSNWKRGSEIQEDRETEQRRQETRETSPDAGPSKPTKIEKLTNAQYLSDEKMNKLGAKIVKAEIMGDTKLVQELKAKLEAAREYRKQNPDAGQEQEEEGVMLIATNSVGNSMPLVRGERGDPRSEGRKGKVDTHKDGQRSKYFGDDDKYNLSQMFQKEKYGNNFDDEAELARVAAKSKNPEDLEDIFVDEITKNKNDAKDQELQRKRAVDQHVRLEKSLEGCEYCVDSRNMLKHLMVTCGSKVYLALPAKQSLVKGHCIITTIQHTTCVTALDEDVWDEVLTFRKALTQFYNSQHQDVVFFETATRLHKFPHIVINCVPMPRDVGDVAAIYFKKALLECEAEWSMNKKVVDLKGKNIRKGVPKGLPYFWIDFGMDPGFAHVIEDQQLFPKNFAEEVIGGILDLDHHLWKNPRKEYGDLQRKKVIEFIKEWKPFEGLVKSKN